MRQRGTSGILQIKVQLILLYILLASSLFTPTKNLGINTEVL